MHPRFHPHRATAPGARRVRRKIIDEVMQAPEAPSRGRQGSQKIVFDQYMPHRPRHMVMIDLAPMVTIADVPETLGRLVVPRGGCEVSPDDARILGQFLDQQRRTRETIEFVARLVALEDAVGLGGL
jgi:hypothetical protein